MDALEGGHSSRRGVSDAANRPPTSADHGAAATEKAGALSPATTQDVCDSDRKPLPEETWTNRMLRLGES